MTFLVVVVLRWLRQRAAAAAPRKERDRLVFGASGVKAVYGIGAVVALAILLTLLDNHQPAWLVAVPGLFLCLFLYSWPADIVLDAAGIAQRHWWGRKVVIAWNEVSSICHRSGDNSTFVFAQDGRDIRHTGFHADSARFQAEVKSRSQVSQVGDWDAVPSLIRA